MNLQKLEKLAACARQAPAPSVDVERAVLRRLTVRPSQAPAAGEAARLWSATFAYLAAAGVVAASFGAALALQAWASLTSPLSGLFNSFVVMIP